jgi:ATP-dependent Zn protease
MRKKKEQERQARRLQYLAQQRTEQPLMSAVGPISPEQLRVNAIHEAGHAVIMTRIAYGCDVVTVDPQEVERLTGHAMPGYTKPVQKQIDVPTYLCTALAGVASEAMHANDGKISPLEEDFNHANEVLDRAGIFDEARRDSAMATARAETEKLVAEHKADILAVADALVQRLTLKGHEVRALLR